MEQIQNQPIKESPKYNNKNWLIVALIFSLVVIIAIAIFFISKNISIPGVWCGSELCGPDEPFSVEGLGPYCGNGFCDGKDNWKNCPTDCKHDTKKGCGDKVCEAKEIKLCPQDCPSQEVCGDGICGLNEDCKQDCQELPPQDLTQQTVCGDDNCGLAENCSNCPADCSDCASPSPVSRGSHFGVQGASTFTTEMKEAGVEITRVWIEWDKIEPENNNYDWSEMDSTVTTSNNAGIEILGYFIDMPEWARDETDSDCAHDGKTFPDVCTPKNWGDYEEFAKEVAQRYDGNHGHGEMKYIGVFNEVQLFSGMTAENYSQFLTKGYSAIKQGNPNAQVLIGSFLDPFEFDYTPTFIDAMFRDYSQYFDITDFHVYRKEKGVSETSSYIKERMQNYGIDKPMWITETASNFGTIPCNLDWYDDIAIDVVKRYTRAFSEGVDKVFWFAFLTTPIDQENTGGVECGGAHNFLMGSLGWSVKKTAEFHPRPAYYAYQTMTSKLRGFASVEKITDTQYKFNVNGKNVYVLWCENGVGCNPPISSGIVTDYLGNPMSEITLSESPIFVE